MANKKMKIAFITDVIWPFTIGGSELRNYEISKRLVQRGHEVHIYGGRFWLEKEKIKNIDGVIIHGVSGFRKLYDQNGKRKRIDTIKLGIKMFFALLKTNHDVYDVLAFSFLNVYATWLVCLIKRKKMVITWQQYFDDYLLGLFGKKVGRILMIMEKISLKLTPYNIAVSESVKNKLIKAGMKESKITIIENGIDYEEIDKIEKKEVSNDLIFVGRLHYQKNLNFLLEIVSEAKKTFKKIILKIIGDGPDRKILIRETEKMKLSENIVFLGQIEDRKEIYKHLKCSKIFILPSIFEGFPLAVLEANACGIPVLALESEQFTLEEYLDGNKNGMILKTDPKIFATQISKILNGERKIEIDLAEIKNKYDWNIISQKQIEYYSSLE